MEKPSQLVEERLNKAEKLRSMGMNPYPAGFKYDLTIAEALEKFSGKDDEGLSAEGPLSIAGRLVTLRSFGKAAFAHIRDRSGRIQIYVKKDMVPAECMDVFGLVDVGDFIGIRGRPFRTRTGELTILVNDLKVLSKAIRPL
ncbi:MAG: lysine--tRNA ligase, partial [Deltaproteobacteria bacterium CG17_big_fil_post_rev_8_21_14_2_50_51_6]